MVIRYYVLGLFLFLLGVPLAQGQISIDKAKPHADGHSGQQDSAYHCGMCNKYLFGVHEITNIGGDLLHYHGIGTDGTKSSIHCSGCNNPLGYYNHEHHNYQVLNKNIDKKDSGEFHCSSCQMPLFSQQDIGSTDERYFYFEEPIKKDRIEFKERNKFYKVTGSHITCKACNARIGSVSPNDDGAGFGIRLNIGSVKKRGRRGQP